MSSDQDEVPAAAVIAAMELVKGLGDNENAMPGVELLDLIRDTRVTPEELTQGFALLISSFMHLLNEPMNLVPPVIRKLRALELVPEEVLPTMAGALTAAALGQSPSRWRHDVGASTPTAEHWEGRLGLYRMAAGGLSRLRGGREWRNGQGHRQPLRQAAGGGH